MCGITGIFDPEQSYSRDTLRSHVTVMASTIRHRGPDDSGTWVADSCGVAFGFQRLSIVDLSEAGHQPMQSASKRFTIVFNGEIYNAEELRSELPTKPPSVSFRGHSDTEVMLAAFEEWGIEPSLRKFNGMFAFAVWDAEQRALFLARDRMGEKPLYFGWFGRTLLFGSELKALRAHPAFEGDIDRDSLTLLLRFNCIPVPYTIYSQVQKLAPATLLRVRARGSTSSIKYWSLNKVIDDAVERPSKLTDDDAVQSLDHLLRDSVRLRMLADVPLGAFLSGGIDSSTVVALMQSVSSRPVNTFTIGVTESSYDESRDARAVAKHLGTNHTELYVTAEEVQSVIPKLAEIYDEPFADSSQLPTYTVAALTRRYVTVALSGDGGDELFGGYNRYIWLQRVRNASAWIPSPLRRTVAALIDSVPVSAWDSLYDTTSAFLPKNFSYRLPGEKLHKISGVLDSSDARAMYVGLASHWQDPARIVIGAKEPATLLNGGVRGSASSTLIEYMMYSDAVTYLPDDILVKLDRATMAVALEARVPMLDHRVVEFACRLPLTMKIRDGIGKWILRQVLYKYVPRELIERPKMGFGIPLHAWLRGPLRDWAEALLDAGRLQSEGYFDAVAIRSKWAQHLSAKRDWGYHLWDVLMFQSWLEANRERSFEPVEA